GDVQNRIENYCYSLQPFEHVCKPYVKKIFKIAGQNIALCGEIDHINLTHGVLIDYKFSESQFKLEWFLQVLIYYALLCDNQEKKHIKYNISKLQVFNVMKGEIYELTISKQYNYKLLLEFIQNLLKRDICNTHTHTHTHPHNYYHDHYPEMSISMNTEILSMNNDKIVQQKMPDLESTKIKINFKENNNNNS